MSHIINKKVGNAIYVYEQICYRENGRVRTKQKIIGKLDADGNIIPSKKRASAAATFLNNSQNSLTSTKASTPETIESTHGNDEAIITIFANVNNLTTTPMPGNHETSVKHAIPAIATNNLVAATPATTYVTDSVSDTLNIPVMSDESPLPVAMSTAESAPVADNIPNNISYDVFAETPAEASTDAIQEASDKPNEPNEAQTLPMTFIETIEVNVPNKTGETKTPHLYSHTYDGYEIIDNNDVIDKEILRETEGSIVQETSAISTNLANLNAPNEQDVVEVVGDVTQEKLPQVTSQKAEQFKFNMSKIENIAFTPSKNVSVYEATGINDVKVNVSRGKSPKKRVETLLYIDFNDAKANGLDISNEDRLTPYDREVHNAVATLSAAGNVYINPYMIFQVLSGNSSDKTKSGMSPETREKIVKSLNKMRFTNVKINASAEVKAGMILEGTFENYLIPAKRTEVMLNGQIIKDCIYLYDVLPMFNYASMKNQIASVDIRMLDTPLANTHENIVLKFYVLKRILSISNDKNNMHDVIRYSTVYEYLNIQASNKDLLNHKRKQIRDKIRKLLNYWKGEKLVKDYKEEKEGRTFAKVIIFVS